MTRTLTAPGQDTLWDLTPPAPTVPAQAPAPLKKTRRFHRLDLPAPLRGVCNPRCLVCGRDENTGLCAPCSIVCHQPSTGTPIEVCLTTTRVTARLTIGIHGFEPGRKLAVVDCPFCERLHTHTPRFGRHYRLSGCGQPYIVTLPRPRINPRTGLTTPVQPPNLSKAAT